MDLENWMTNYDPNRSIADLLIPGTHDTITASCTDPYYRTQSLDLTAQLRGGVRFLDIRLRCSLYAAHREWISPINADQIFTETAEFLALHPGETVLMRIQNANENKDDFPEYKAALLDKISSYREIFYRCGLDSENEASGDKEETLPVEKPWPGNWPSLGEAAGKILPFECAPRQYKIDQLAGENWAIPWWENPRLKIQDLWDGPELETKQRVFTENLYQSQQDREQRLFLNHVSATNGQLGNPGAYAERMNSWTLRLWSRRNKTAPQIRGVQIYDFITPEICQSVLVNNI